MKNRLLVGVLLFLCVLGFSCTKDSKESKTGQPAKTDESVVKQNMDRLWKPKKRDEKTAAARWKRQRERTRRISKLDTDGDDKVSRAEWMMPIEDRFKRLDTNADGLIAENELENLGYRRQRWLLKQDIDNDQKISTGEWERSHELRFDRADRDKDGFVTKTEMTRRK